MVCVRSSCGVQLLQVDYFIRNNAAPVPVYDDDMFITNTIIYYTDGSVDMTAAVPTCTSNNNADANFVKCGALGLGISSIGTDASTSDKIFALVSAGHPRPSTPLPRPMALHFPLLFFVFYR